MSFFLLELLRTFDSMECVLVEAFDFKVFKLSFFLCESLFTLVFTPSKQIVRQVYWICHTVFLSAPVGHHLPRLSIHAAPLQMDLRSSSDDSCPNSHYVTPNPPSE